MSRKILRRLLFFARGARGAQHRAGRNAEAYGSALAGKCEEGGGTALGGGGENKWTVAVAIVGPAGTLIYYEKMDNTQLGSAEVAIDKLAPRRCSSGRRRRFRMYWRVEEMVSGSYVEGRGGCGGRDSAVMDGKIVWRDWRQRRTSAAGRACAKPERTGE